MARARRDESITLAPNKPEERPHFALEVFGMLPYGCSRPTVRWDGRAWEWSIHVMQRGDSGIIRGSASTPGQAVDALLKRINAIKELGPGSVASFATLE